MKLSKSHKTYKIQIKQSLRNSKSNMGSFYFRRSMASAKGLFLCLTFFTVSCLLVHSATTNDQRFLQQLVKRTSTQEKAKILAQRYREQYFKYMHNSYPFDFRVFYWMSKYTIVIPHFPLWLVNTW